MKRCLIFAPAYAYYREPKQAQAVVQRIADQLNWQVDWAASCQAAIAPGHCLSVEQRQQELQGLCDYDICWALRGGYGCVHLLPWLAQQTKTEAPLLIGYSDLTLLHGLWQRKGWGPSLYAMMPAVAAGPRAQDSLLRLLQKDLLTLTGAEHPAVRILFPGSCQGRCFAACLSVLAAAVGGPAMPELKDCILFLEDIDEPPYRIDRFLWQLFLAGHLASLRGLVFASFPLTQPHPGPALQDVLQTWAERLGVPCLSGLPFGHDPDPLALPCQGWAALSCSDQWSIDLCLSHNHPSLG